MSRGRNIVDDVIAVIAPSLGDRMMIVPPDSDDDRLRFVYGTFEVRIWKDNHGYTYEILSAAALLARGETSSAYAALERAMSLTVMLNGYGRARRAA
jgi:hypothetical protein